MSQKIMPFDSQYPNLGIKKLCDWFIDEQKEEEENVGSVIKTLKEAEKSKKAQNSIDLEIAQLRKFE